MAAVTPSTQWDISIRGRRARFLIGALLTTVVVAAAIWSIDGAHAREALLSLAGRPELLAMFVGGYTVAFSLRAAAWRRLLPGLGLRRGFSVLMVALMANHLLPFKGGEVLRPVLAARSGVTLEAATVSTVAARAIDFLSVLALAVGLMTTAPAAPLAGGLTFAIALVCIAGATGVMAWWWIANRQIPLPGAVGPIVGRVRSAARAMTFRQLADATLWTFPSWVLEAVAVWVAAQAVGVDLPPHAAVAVTAFTILFQTFHFTPGGLGMYEASMTGALMAFGVPVHEAFGLAVLTHGIKFGYAFSVGVAFTVAEVKPAAGWVMSLGATALTLAWLVSTGLPWLWLAAGLGAALPCFVLARQWSASSRPLPPEPMGQGPVVVVIPAYNEAANLPSTLAAVPHHLVDSLRVVVVDDGSSDRTAAVAEAHGADVVVRHAHNRGLGAALRTGLAEARAMGCRAAVYLDADGEYDAAFIPALLGEVEQHGADYVLGSRYLGRRSKQQWSRNLANRAFTAVLCVAAGKRITDGQTGFRAFSRRAVEAAEIIHDYNYAQVLTLDLLRKRMRFAEVPIDWRRREHGASFVRLEYLWRVPFGMVRQLLKS